MQIFREREGERERKILPPSMIRSFRFQSPLLRHSLRYSTSSTPGVAPLFAKIKTDLKAAMRAKDKVRCGFSALPLQAALVIYNNSINANPAGADLTSCAELYQK